MIERKGGRTFLRVLLRENFEFLFFKFSSVLPACSLFLPASFFPPLFFPSFLSMVLFAPPLAAAGCG